MERLNTVCRDLEMVAGFMLIVIGFGEVAGSWYIWPATTLCFGIYVVLSWLRGTK